MSPSVYLDAESDTQPPNQAASSIGSGKLVRHKWLFVLKLAISTILLSLLLMKVGWQEVYSHLSQADVSVLKFVVAMFLAQVAVLGLAWHVCLRQQNAKLSAYDTFSFSAAGLFFNQLMPAWVGSIAARALLAHRAGVPLRAAVSSIFLERMCNLIALITIVALSLTLFAALQLHHLLNMILFSAGISTILIVAIALTSRLHRFAIFQKQSTPWRQIGVLSSSLHQFLRAPRAFTQALGLGIVWHLLNLGALYLCAQALGLSFPVAPFLAVAPLAFLCGLVPISVAGWGVRESALVVLLGLIGVVPGKALAVSVIFGALLLLTRAIGVLPWLLSNSSKSSKLADAN